MIYFDSTVARAISYRDHGWAIFFYIIALVVFFGPMDVRAGGTLRGGANGFQSANNGSNSAAATSQTATAATSATSQAAQTAIIAHQAQASMVHSLQALQAMQAAQNAARTAAAIAPSNLGTEATALPTVVDGIGVNGLVPGSPSDPTPVVMQAQVVANTNGTKSVTLGTNSALTLPTNIPGASQIQVSGTGSVGTITAGGTISTLTAGVSRTIAPGSTISLPNGGTVTFAAGSAVPLTFATYAYATPPTATVPAGTSAIPVSWAGVGGLSESTYTAPTGQSSGETTVTVTQTAQQALLSWQNFNIGKNTVLDFDQSSGGANVGSWVAINKIADNIAPSQILGTIQAPGQVYVINQNGIIFGGTSQVNVGALVASSLPINNNLVGVGLLNNPDLQFLFSQLNQSSGSAGPTPASTPQGTSSAPGTSPAPGSYSSGGLISQVDSAGQLSLVNAAGQDGDVVVQAGAKLSSPTTPQHVGGKIALVGPNVNNAGTISSPDGQVILAAGLQVGFTASTDASLRGLDVTVGQVTDPTYEDGAAVSGTATNKGDIEAPRADVLITGENVNQLGLVNSSTSVALNGRVDLLANYGGEVLVNSVNGFNGSTGVYFTESGAVTFGMNSVTQILPELSSADTVVGSSLALASRMMIQGKTIDLAPTAEILAPSAKLTFDAGDWLSTPTGYEFFNAKGQVYLGQAANIDVSGSENVSASVADNIIAVQLLGTELANSPSQQKGALRGQTVDIDIRETGTYDGVSWIGTPIGDVSGYVNLIPHTVGELTTAGGTVDIAAGNSVVMQNGSTINVAGGWINYAGATVETTKVVSGGQLYDISQATPDLVYSGIYTGTTSSSTKWGITQTYSNPVESGIHYEAGYIQGGNGGAISITTPAMALDGTLSGDTVAGAYQLTPISRLSSTYSGATFLPTTLAVSGVPDSSSLSLIFEGDDSANAAANYPTYSPTPPNVVFQNGNSGQAIVGAFATDPSSGDPVTLPSDRVGTVVLSPNLVNSEGFGSLAIINRDGNITVPADVSLKASLGGSASISAAGVPLLGANETTLPIEGDSIVFSAANLTIDGSVSAPGGSLLFSVYDFSPYTILPVGSNTPLPDAIRGNFTLGATASLNTSGLVVNDEVVSSNGRVPELTDGGSIKIASYNAELSAGSLINVSGGAEVTSSGKQSFGRAGSITIAAGQDLDYPSLLGGKLTLGSTLQALSGSTGGSLAITAPLIQIGGSSLVNGDTNGETLWLNRTNGNGKLVSPDFFSQGGFGSFSLNGLGETVVDSSGNPKFDSAGNPEFSPAVLIASHASINPVAESWQAVLGTNSLYLAATTPSLPSERTPVSLNFNAKGVSDSETGLLVLRGDFVMDVGASIVTDPQTNGLGGVSINAQTAAILGSITVPGGTISITGGSSFANVNSVPLLEPTVDLGPNSYLSTKGAVVITPNAFGLPTGSVLSGGNISVAGNIVAEAGAVLDVSGTSSVLYVQPGQAGINGGNIHNTIVPRQEDSNGGSITLSGSQELFSDATLLGAAGGPAAAGGSLTISSGLFLPTSASVETPLDMTLIVTQGGLTIPVPAYYPSGETAIGNPVVDSQGNQIAGRGYFAVNSFDNPRSGFDSLTLAGTVDFRGPIVLTARNDLTIASDPKKPSGGIIYADSQVVLTAPYIDLGQAFLGPENAEAAAEPAYVDSNSNSFHAPPVYGTGNLQVNASLIDVGNLSLQGIGLVSLNAVQGDVRGDGTLEVAGDLTVTAGQIYPLTDTTLTLAAYDHNGINGSITITGSGSRALPLSAGGTLNIYASNISQGGVLRAPIGKINLGSGVTSASPTDSIAGEQFDATQQLVLASGSDTSVSAVDPVTGEVLDIPYGVNVNGVQWNDPAGNNITTAGNGPNAIPAKSIVVSALNVVDQAGSTIDISGGGDIYAYQFVTGTGGTVNKLNLPNNSYAILPASYSTTTKAVTYSPSYAADGYSNQNSPVAVGEEVYLGASSGLKAGYYTLLPSIYALQPNGYLVTLKSSVAATGTVPQSDGSSLVSGYFVNGNNPASGQPLLTTFQVDPPAVVKTLAQYNLSSGTTFLAQSAASSGIATPRLPIDAGQLILAAQSTLVINGSVLSAVPLGGQGSLVDIASPSDILIAGANADLSQVPNTTLVLSSSGLTAFGADSLLIGGYRGSTTRGGTSVTVTTSDLTVDNSGSDNALAGPDIILVSNDELTLDADAQVEQGSRTLAGAAQTLALGIANLPGSGDGTLLRVTSDSKAGISRLGVNSADPASLYIGAGATINGTNLTLDSTDQSTLLSTALTGDSVSINSGLISLVLDSSGAAVPQGLVLSNATLQSLQSSATALSLLSYSAIDIYGSGSIGGQLGSTGRYPVTEFALHAAAIRGDGGSVAINAQTISLDNSSGAVETGNGPIASAGGTLTFNAGTVELGASGQTAANGIIIGGYDNVNVNASGGILLLGAGSTTTSTGTVVRGSFSTRIVGTGLNSGNLILNTPLITGATAANQTITAGGALTIQVPDGEADATLAGGNGADLALVGQSISVNSDITLTSGKLELEATTGNLTVGNTGPTLINLGGTTKMFNDLPEYTSGGQIMLNADASSVILASGGTLNLAAPHGGGNGGSLSVAAPLGTFLVGSTLYGSGGAGGTNGIFSLDVGTVNTSTSLAGNDLTPVETVLNKGGFTQTQSIRIRGGIINGASYNDVYLNGTTGSDEVNAWSYNLSADTGSIIVNGGINAAGAKGGSIDLAAAGSVTLTAQARVTTAGETFNDAGKGGSVTLAAGSDTEGESPVSTQSRSSTTGDFTAGTAAVNIQSGSTIDLSVGTNSGEAGRAVNLTSSGSSFLNLPQASSFTLPFGTPGNDIIAFSSAGTVTSGGTTTSFAAGSSLTGLAPGSLIQLTGSGAVKFAGGSSGSAIPVALAANVNYTLGALGDSTGTLHLRGPQLADGSDVQVDPIHGSILNASTVVVEGYKVYAPTGGLIDRSLEGNALTSTAGDGSIYGDALGFTANTNAILKRLLGASPTAAQSALYQIVPGAEIINTTGDLTLARTWDLSTFRFGPNADPNIAGSGVPGILTLRAAGNLVFSYSANASASLSDGFTGYDGSTTSSLWQSTVMPGQSWSYHLTAGADFAGVNPEQVESLANLTRSGLGGSVQLGLGAPALPTATNGLTSTIVPKFYEVIRTGTGNITLSAGNDVELLNPLETIYTAGTQAPALANFASPNLSYKSTSLGSNPVPLYQATYSQSGGDVTITAQEDIGRYLMTPAGILSDNSSKELPTSWLFRQGFIQNGQFAATHPGGPVAATSWWVDFNNYFEGVGALGGGNVSLVAGNNISNVDAALPTNARMPGTIPNATSLIELGGGDLLVQAGGDISGGVYYVERGTGALIAGGSIHSNSTRAALSQTNLSILGQIPADSTTWLPTTLFLGKGSFNVSAEGSLELGPIANPFLLPQSIFNSFYNKTYFSTFAESDLVKVSALTGSVTLKDNVENSADGYYEGPGSLVSWYSNVLLKSSTSFAASEPWLTLVETNVSPFDPAFALLPSSLSATAFSSDINIIGGLTLSPSPQGTINLAAAGSVNGFQANAVVDSSQAASTLNPVGWASSTINLSDADPARIPGVASPLSFPAPASGFQGATWAGTSPSLFSGFADLFNETGMTNGVLQARQSLHTPALLHANDTDPLRIYAQSGDISGLTLYSGKFVQVEAGHDITDISFYIQNDDPGNISLIRAGRDLVAYDINSALRQQSQMTGNEFLGENATFLEGQTVGAPTNGDIQINGPGTLEVLAGRNFDLGVGPSGSEGISVGLTSVGNQRDPYLSFGGANVVTASGLSGDPDYKAFTEQFLTPGTNEGTRYLPELGTLMGLINASDSQVSAAFNSPSLPDDTKALLVQDLFFDVLRDSGRDRNTVGLPGSGNYNAGFSAIAALFPGNIWQGDISLTSREIKTENGGNISVLAPGGQLTVGFDISGNQPVDQGILTVDGGNISIFTKENVNVGTSRIFTLNGGNEIIWSSQGDIAAGASSKTVQSAPPTRVVIDPQSADVRTDLSGLATGGGIGVLETVQGAQASDVDLIAPNGSVDAGDAGIRASGNLNIAAVQVLNAGNIQVGGKSSGTPTATVANVAGLASASSAAGAANNAASEVGRQQQNRDDQPGNDLPSIITVEVIGYGGV